jgi:RNA polymerase sigma factor (sigma-70 family)
VDEKQWLAAQFEEHRAHLNAVAYQMLGSVAEAEDAVQDTWVRLARSGTDDVGNLAGWLTTITARVCLNMLRSRHLHREESLQVRLPDPVVEPDCQHQPEEQALLADSVGLAMLVVLDTLSPHERLVFVLHDVFDLPFDEIAPMIDRTPAAARQLASRARRRIKGAGVPAPDPDLARQREVVDAFFAAARDGDFDALATLLAPDVVLRIDAGARYPSSSMIIRGTAAVAQHAATGLAPALRTADLLPVLVNGSAGIIVRRHGRPLAVMGFTVTDGKIAVIDSIADPERVGRRERGDEQRGQQPQRVQQAGRLGEHANGRRPGQVGEVADRRDDADPRRRVGPAFRGGGHAQGEAHGHADRPQHHTEQDDPPVPGQDEQQHADDTEHDQADEQQPPVQPEDGPGGDPGQQQPDRGRADGQARLDGGKPRPPREDGDPAQPERGGDRPPPAGQRRQPPRPFAISVSPIMTSDVAISSVNTGVAAACTSLARWASKAPPSR